MLSEWVIIAAIVNDMPVPKIVKATAVETTGALSTVATSSHCPTASSSSTTPIAGIRKSRRKIALNTAAAQITAIAARMVEALIRAVSEV